MHRNLRRGDALEHDVFGFEVAVDDRLVLELGQRLCGVRNINMTIYVYVNMMFSGLRSQWTIDVSLSLASSYVVVLEIYIRLYVCRLVRELGQFLCGGLEIYIRLYVCRPVRELGQLVCDAVRYIYDYICMWVCMCVCR